MADAPISGLPVVIELGVRRFFCDHPDCPKRTFAEQVPGVDLPVRPPQRRAWADARRGRAGIGRAYRHRGCWTQPAEPNSVEPNPAAEPNIEPSAEPEVVPDPQQLAEQAAIARRKASALVTRTRERYTAGAHDLRAQGKGIKAIMPELGLAKETVRRFARATTVEDLLGTARAGRPSVLDEYKPYLHELVVGVEGVGVAQQHAARRTRLRSR